MIDMSGKTVAVTGGAAGIGLAIARRFRAQGADVIVLDRDRVAMDEATRAHGFQCVTADAEEPEECVAGLCQAVEEYGRLDVLVNNAGLFQRKPNSEVTVDDWLQLLRINLLTPFFLSEAVCDVMAREPGSSIICISSVAAYYARPDQAAYCTSKTALEQLVRVLALQLAEKGIRVNAVRPGAIKSRMIGGDIKKLGNGRIKIPLGSFGAPEDIAECVSYLTGARHVTGQIITVDGGQTLQFVNPFA